MLSQTHNLVELNLSANKLTEKHVKSLAPYVRNAASLRNLDLSHNKIGIKGMRSLAKLLQCPEVNLCSLKVDSNDLSYRENKSEEFGQMNENLAQGLSRSKLVYLSL